MKIPSNLFINSVEGKKVYFFDRTTTIGVADHRHICITKTADKILYFACTTSQEDTINRFIEKQKIPASTVVYIKKDGSIFKKDTFINCNSIFEISEEDFKNEYDNNRIDFMGEISDNHYDQVLTGIMESPLVECEIKDIVSTIK